GFKDDAGLLNLRKLFKDRGPLTNLLFPTRFVGLESASHSEGGNSVFLGEVRNLFGASLVLNESAFSRQLLNRLLVCCIGCQPQAMPDGFVIVLDDRCRCDS